MPQILCRWIKCFSYEFYFDPIRNSPRFLNTSLRFIEIELDKLKFRMTSTHSKKRKSNSNSAKLKHKKFYDQRPTESYAQMKYGFVPRDDLDESPQKDRNFENSIEEAKILTPELRIPRADVPGERILSNISTNNKIKHPDRQLYIHPYKQKNRAINKIKSAEAEEKIYYVKRSEEKDSAQNLSQDSAPNLSSASTNVSSEKIRPTSNDNSGEKLERIKADLFNSGSTFLTDAIAKVREDERQRIPFFELELTLSDDVNAAISVYQVLIFKCFIEVLQRIFS